MNFPPCPQPVNWPVYKLCSNQVLFLKNLASTKAVSITCSLTCSLNMYLINNEVHVSPHFFLTAILYNHTTIGTCSHRLPFIFHSPLKGPSRHCFWVNWVKLILFLDLILLFWVQVRNWLYIKLEAVSSLTEVWRPSKCKLWFQFLHQQINYLCFHPYPYCWYR